MDGRISGVKIAILGLAAVGLIAVFGLAGWGVSKAVKNAQVHPLRSLASLISSITLRKEIIEPSVVITLSEKVVESGESIDATWTYDGFRAGGAYVLSYVCQDGASLALESNEVIACNSPFNLWSRNSISLVPTLKGEAPIDLKIEVGYIPQGSTMITESGIAVLTIAPKGSQEIPAEDNNSQTATSGSSNAALTPGQQKSKVYLTEGSVAPIGTGAANLSIEIIDVGIINESTNVFQHATSVSQNMRAGTVFDVTNRGGVASQPWVFRALLPVANGNFRSDTQDPLAPGSKVRFTIGFKDLTNAGNNSIIITVDPDNQLSDADRTNNTASTSIYRSY